MNDQQISSGDTLDGPRRKKACPYGTDKRKGKRNRCLKHPRPKRRRR